MQPHALLAGMVLCGDPNNPIVMLPEVYVEVEPVLSSCPSDCSNSAAATGPTNFYWDVSAWGGCSVACGGELQTRDVLCFSSIDGRWAQAGKAGISHA